jgi:hypothetical protein
MLVWALYWAALAAYVVVTPYAFWKGSTLARLGFGAYLVGLLLQNAGSFFLKGDTGQNAWAAMVSLGMCVMWLVAAMRWPKYWLCGALGLESVQLYLYSSFLAGDEFIAAIIINATNILALLWLANFAFAVMHEQHKAKSTRKPAAAKLSGAPTGPSRA